VLKEVSRKVTKIQDPALSDYQIRDLNDELNKLFREKWQWEVRIRELGGPNYMRGGGRVTDEEGRVIEGGGKGYRYFGRAKELPGVKELFEAATRKPAEEERSKRGGEVRHDLLKRIDAGYYGYNLDEEDGKLEDYETLKEAEAYEALLGQDETSMDWAIRLLAHPLARRDSGFQGDLTDFRLTADAKAIHAIRLFASDESGAAVVAHWSSGFLCRLWVRTRSMRHCEITPREDAFPTLEVVEERKVHGLRQAPRRQGTQVIVIPIDNPRAVDTLISKKPQIEEVGDETIIKAGIQLLLSDHLSFSDEVLKRTPADVLLQANEVVDVITVALRKGVVAFSG
ncbi:Pre-mRNA-splicing factor, partial [Hortaea werneckii]